MTQEQEKQLGIKSVGSKITIPDIPTARLMCYLKMINRLTDYEIPDKLSDFTNYSYLTYEEKKQILNIAIMISPDILIENRVIFKEPKLCDKVMNSIFELTGEASIPTPNDFNIMDKSVHPVRVMAYNDDYLNKFYYRPIKGILKELEVEANKEMGYEVEYPNVSTNAAQSRSAPDTDNSRTVSKSKCCLIC